MYQALETEETHKRITGKKLHFSISHFIFRIFSAKKMSAKKESSASPKAAAASSSSSSEPMVPRGSVLVSQLPAGVKDIYSHLIPRFFPAPKKNHADKKKSKNENTTATAQEDTGDMVAGAHPSAPAANNKVAALPPAAAALFSQIEVLEEADNATLLLQVPSQEAAKKLFKRLQNVRCCGRRWKVQYMPLSSVTCSTEPCLMQCTLVPPSPQSVAEEVLRSIPGFLAVAKATPAKNGGSSSSDGPSHAGKNGRQPPHVSEVEEDVGEEWDGNGASGVVVETLLASFCDEGSGLHAKAILSGRLIGSSGVRMFVERRIKTA